MAAAKHIPVLVNAEGESLSSWDDMANHTLSYFRDILGGPADCVDPLTKASHKATVMAAVNDRLTQQEKANINGLFTMGELRDAVDAMKSHKCPGPDGAPVEFFQTLWATVGPLITLVLNEGITRGEFTEKFSLGLIVLLPKKGDQRLLSNKRPITLLNVAYKIGAKALQHRLTPILQRIISPQQSAFLSGRNIHHSLVMLGEMLHQAAVSGEEHLLLKFDVVKAFDTIEWPFLLDLLEKSGFSGTLTGFLRASFAHPSSAILLNGTPTASIPLSRSVRQGCPLSPCCSFWPSMLLARCCSRLRSAIKSWGSTFLQPIHTRCIICMQTICPWL